MVGMRRDLQVTIRKRQLKFVGHIIRKREVGARRKSGGQTVTRQAKAHLYRGGGGLPSCGVWCFGCAASGG